MIIIPKPKFRIEHCPNGCHIHSPDIPKWHYRVEIQGFYPVWGTWNRCIEWIIERRSI